MAKTLSKKRKVIVESIGEAHVTASFNNIIISLTNTKGEVISWSSAGKMGFRGSKKNTPYAAQTAAEDCSKVAHGILCPTMTFSLRPSNKSTFPFTAASFNTFVVSWKEAAEMKDLV